MTLPVLILGGGGHAKVVIAALQAAGVEIAGIVDADPARVGGAILEIPVIGDDRAVAGFAPETVRLTVGVGSTGDPSTRQSLFARFRQRRYRFATVVHPAAVIVADSALGEGTQVMAGAVIQPGCRIGANVIVNTSASIDHDCVVGDHVHIAPGCTLSGGVTIGKGAHLGTGATVIEGIDIGSRCLIAAGTVVTKPVAPGARISGVPGREA